MDALAHQHVAIIHRDSDVAHAHLAGTGIAHVYLLDAQHLGPAVLVEAECLAHYASSLDSCFIISARSSSAARRACAAICGESTTLSNASNASSLRPRAWSRGSWAKPPSRPDWSASS